MATTRSAGALFVTIGYPSIVLVGPAGVLVPCKQRGGDYGPTMVYSRLEAYCFIGLSEGAYGRS
jgi:hypothetical protein